MDTQTNILKTLLYYDLVGKPLTLFEIWQWLSCKRTKETNNKIPFSQIESKINQLVAQKRIKKFRGFYFLPSRNKRFVGQRIKHERYSQQKIKKLKRKIKFIRYLPYTRAIFVNGSLLFESANKKSDLDVIIITKPKRIWLTRAFITIVSILLNRYRTKQTQNNRLCFNHYLTTDNLKISFQDLSSAQLHSKTYCLWNFNNRNQKLLNQFQKQNKWFDKFLTNHNPHKLHIDYRVKSSSLSILVQKTFELLLSNAFGNWLENFSKKQQLKSINKSSKNNLSNARIVTKDDELIFHPDPINEKMMKRYNQKLAMILKSV